MAMRDRPILSYFIVQSVLVSSIITFIQVQYFGGVEQAVEHLLPVILYKTSKQKYIICT